MQIYCYADFEFDRSTDDNQHRKIICPDLVICEWHDRGSPTGYWAGAGKRFDDDFAAADYHVHSNGYRKRRHKRVVCNSDRGWRRAVRWGHAQPGR